MRPLIQFKLITILIVLMWPCVSFSMKIPPDYILPYKRVIRNFTDNVIFSRSDMQRLVITDTIVDRPVDHPPTVWILAPDSVDSKYSVLFVSVMEKSGLVRMPKWHIEHSKLGLAAVRLLVVDDFVDLAAGSVLRIGILARITQSDGFFVAFEDGFQPRDGLIEFSGCIKVASHLSIAMKHNDGIVVSRMTDSGQGYHGWCYHDRPLPDKPKYYLHYFAASTAESWGDVASWYRESFANVISKDSRRKEDIVAELGLHMAALDEIDKVRRVREWMNSHLRYSGAGSYAHVPQSFDNTVRTGFAECKGLSLVMIELLRAAGMRAHLVITSTENPWLFSNGINSSARLNSLNHVEVYLPDLDLFLDPTTPSGPGSVGSQAMDVETGKVMVIH